MGFRVLVVILFYGLEGKFTKLKKLVILGIWGGIYLFEVIFVDFFKFFVGFEF